MPQSCKYTLHACSDPTADNYVSAWASYSNGLPSNNKAISTFEFAPAYCQYGGCNDTQALNYDSTVREAP